MNKIAFINIFSGSRGGGEIYLKRLITNLRFFIRSDSVLITPCCPVLDDCRINKVPILGIGINERFTIKKYFKIIVQIRRILKFEQPDIVVINGDRAIVLSVLFGFRGKKIGIKHMLINSNWKFYINYLSFSRISDIVTISKFHRSNYVKWFGKSIYSKIKVIYNAVNTEVFNSLNKKENKVVRFIEVASIEKRKGQEDLIYAFSALKQKYEDIELYFYGAGPNVEKCKDLVKKLGVKDVYFMGFVKDVELIYEYFPSIFILPSYDEGLPISILEAMSSGIPIITTNIAGIPEAVKNGINGFLITPGDIGGLYNKMETFLYNRDLILKYGENGRKEILNRFDENEWITHWKNLLQ